MSAQRELLRPLHNAHSFGVPPGMRVFVQGFQSGPRRMTSPWLNTPKAQSQTRRGGRAHVRFSDLDPASQALLLLQSGPGVGWTTTVTPGGPDLAIPNEDFWVFFVRHLRVALPLTPGSGLGWRRWWRRARQLHGKCGLPPALLARRDARGPRIGRKRSVTPERIQSSTIPAKPGHGRPWNRGTR